jgi:putative hydrolase of the HAD superfamily
VTHSNAIKFQAVIFDLFGTLVEDFMFSIGASNTNLAEILGVPREPFTQMWRQTSEMRVNGHFQTVEASIAYVCDAIGAKVGPKQLSEAVQSRLQQIKGGLKPKSDAIETLTRLKQIDCKLGLLSNCSIEIPALWPETEFADLFDSAVFSSKDCLKKPDPAIFRLACERLGVSPEACLYIADGENHELAAATEVGLHPVLIRNHLAQRRPKLFREAEEWQGDKVHKLTEIITILNGQSEP